MFWKMNDKLAQSTLIANSYKNKETNRKLCKKLDLLKYLYISALFSEYNDDPP